MTRDRPILALTLLLFAAPVAIDLAAAPARAPFHYFAADAFYYFTVARNAADTGRFTFDQEHLTNGHHPLWQLVATGLYEAADDLGLPETAFLTATVATGLLCVGLAVLLLGWAWQRREGGLPLAFVLLPVGLYALLVAPAWLAVLAAGDLAAHPFAEGPQPLYGTLWSFVNGMESPLALLFFAAATWWLVRHPRLPTVRAAVVLGLLLAGLTLSRLDHGLFAATILTTLAVAGAWRGDRSQVRGSLVAGLASALPVAAYLVVNRMIFGSWVPVSGSLKSTFPEPSGRFVEKMAKLQELPLSAEWLFHLWRETQVLVPAAAALLLLLFLLAVRGHRPEPPDEVGRAWDLLLAATAAGVLLLAAYGFLFVDFFHHGHWYYPVSILFVSLAALRLLEPANKRLGRRPHRPAVQAVLLAALALLDLGIFFGLHHQPEYHQAFERFYFEESRRVIERYGYRGVKLISRDDGIIAFSLPYPTLSGTGLAADPEALEHLERGTFLSLAVARGHDRITSLAYLDATGLTTDSPRRQIRRKIPSWWNLQEDWYSLDLAVEHVSEDGRFAIIRASFVASHTGRHTRSSSSISLTPCPDSS